LLSSITYTIQGSNPEDLANYPELIQYKDSLFIRYVPPGQRIEAGLLTIACLNKVANNEIKKMIGEFLSRHYSLLTDDSLILKTYLCFIINYYPESLFFQPIKNQDLAENYLRFILENVNFKDEKNEPNALFEAANKTLHRLFAMKSLSVFLVPYAIDALRVLTQVFLDQIDAKIMESILKILKNFELQVLEQPDYLIGLMKALVQKLEENVLAENEWYQIAHFLKEICSKDKLMLMIQYDLDEIIQPVTTILQEMDIKNKKDENRHQDLLNILTSLVPVMKNLTLIILSSILKIIPQLLNLRSDSSLEELMHILNQILVVSTEFSSETVSIFVEIGLQLLSDPKNELIVCQGALLLQLIFQFIGSLAESQVSEILEKTYEKLGETEIVKIQIQLLGVILSAFYAKFELVQAVLFEKSNEISIFINLLRANASHFCEISYLLQVTIFGLSNVLNQQNLCEVIKSSLPDLLNLLVSFVQFAVEDEDSRSSKSNSIIEEEFENEEDDEELTKEMIKEMTENIKTKFKDQDGLEFFKAQITYLKQSNPEILENISEKKKKFIDKFLFS